MVLYATQHYNVLIKGKWSNPGKGLAPSLLFGEVDIEKEPLGRP